MTPPAQINPQVRPLLLFGVEHPSMRQIAEAVSRYYGVSLEVMKSPSRFRPIFWARAIAMYEIKQRTKRSLSQIGLFFGGRDHTSVLNAIRRVEAALEASAAIVRQEAA